MINRYLKIIMIFLFTLPVVSTDAAGPVNDDLKNISWHITASTVTYDNMRKLHIARGNVEITGGATRLEADYVEFNEASRDAFAQGNVRLISGEDSISCTAMNINLETQTGKIHKGTLFISKNNLYIYGENIRKTGMFTYDADQGTITSCTGDTPDWKITGKDIRVTIEGYGFAKDVVFWAGQVPALYTPYISFSVKTKRQSGLLTPRFGMSNRKGFQLEQPLFLALSQNTDATIYMDAMTSRGVKAGLEYRYVLDNDTKGTLMFDILKDRKIDDKTAQTKDYSFADTPVRNNSDRYWFRMKHNHIFENDIKAKLDLDVVSDMDYLREFEDGYTGFDTSREYFTNEFGRNLDEYNDTTRINRLNINRIWEQHSLNIDFNWFDNVMARQLDSEDTTLQSIPAIHFSAATQPLWGTRLYYTLNSEITHFYRKDTTASLINGTRIDIHPRISFPVKLGQYFSFEPSVGLRETTWLTDDWMNVHGEFSDVSHRETYDINLSLSTRLEKIYGSDPAADQKIRHDFIPRIEYRFSPDIHQEDFPLFDTQDRLEKINQVTWSITNRLTARYPLVQKSADTSPDITSYRYKELAWVKLSQSYYLSFEEPDPRDFSDIMLDSEFYLNNYASLITDLSWSPYDREFNTLNSGIRLSDTRGDSVAVQYRYKKDLSEYLYARASVKLMDHLTVFSSLEKNLLSSRTTESIIGASLKQSCWSVDMAFSETPEDKKIAFMITLYGLGEFGIK